jgi:hypothetical protein
MKRVAKWAGAAAIAAFVVFHLYATGSFFAKLFSIMGD